MTEYRFPPLPFPTLLELNSASYSAAPRAALDLNHRNSHLVVPISSARSDQIRHVRSLVSALKLRKLGSECQATDQSEKQEQLLRARIEKPAHLRDIPLICPIRRGASYPRCHRPSGGPYDPSESIHRNIYFTTEVSHGPPRLVLPLGVITSMKLREALLYEL
jgi:hypothetical protein